MPQNFDNLLSVFLLVFNPIIQSYIPKNNLSESWQ